MSAVLQTMADEHIGIGENTHSFASVLKEYLGYPFRVIPLRSVIDALTLSLSSLSLKEGAVIGVSALAPSWYRPVIEGAGAELYLLDIDPETLCIDEEKLKASMDSLDALIIDEPYGYQAPVSLYESIDKPVIADISQSFGTAREGIAPGSSADISIMSFEHSDIVSCGGGCAVAFRTEEIFSPIASQVRKLHDHIALGDMNSALGIIQMGQMEENVARRSSFHRRFFLASQRNRHHSYASAGEEYAHNGYTFILTLEGKYEESEAFAKKHGILTERAFHNALIEETREAFTSYPRAAGIATRTMRFPLYPFLTEKEVQQIERVIAHIP